MKLLSNIVTSASKDNLLVSKWVLNLKKNRNSLVNIVLFCNGSLDI